MTKMCISSKNAATWLFVRVTSKLTWWQLCTLFIMGNNVKFPGSGFFLNEKTVILSLFVKKERTQLLATLNSIVANLPC